MNNRVFSYYNNRLAAYKFRMNIVVYFVIFRVYKWAFSKKIAIYNTFFSLTILFSRIFFIFLRSN